MSDVVLVAGATGRLGRELVRAAKLRGARVRALGRSRAKLASAAPEADEFAIADAQDVGALFRAMRGVDRVVSCLGASVIPSPRYGARTFSHVDTPANRALIRAAVEQRVRKFVYVSVFGADRLPGRDFVRAHELVVDDLRASGLAYAVIRPTGFFHSMEEIVLTAGRGLLPEHDRGRARTNPIHEADLAGCCVDAVFDPHAALECDVGGPDVLTRREIAELTARSRPDARRFQRVPVWTLRAGGVAVRPLYPRVGDLLLFIADILVEDFVAPTIGTRRMAEFFAERTGESVHGSRSRAASDARFAIERGRK